MEKKELKCYMCVCIILYMMINLSFYFILNFKLAKDTKYNF